MKEMIYQAERKLEILHSGIYHGCKFAILNLGTHPTAYIECKLDNCNDYDDVRLDEIDVHGGFTFFGVAFWNKDDKTAYLGWDYAHNMDYAGYEIKFPTSLRSYGKRWTTAEIYKEVKAVIEQLNTLLVKGV